MVIGRPEKVRFGRSGTWVHDTIHLQYMTMTHGTGMTNTRPISNTSVRQMKSQIPKSTESGPPVGAPLAAVRCGLSGLRRDGVRAWNEGRTRGAREQPCNIPGFLPARHALGPDQRFRGDRAVGDEVAQLRFQVGTLFLALRRKEPGSV